MRRIEVRMLGGFEVEVDGKLVAPEAWPQRRAADLVKLLALAPGRQLSREQVLEALWPHLEVEAAARNLHKAASYARRALGGRDAVVLARGQVQLAPDAEVGTDVERFETGDRGAYGGELLPDDRYEEWTAAARRRLRERRVEQLREAGDWEALAREEPADEQAQRELARRELDRGDAGAAARRLRRLKAALAERGLPLGEETTALERRLARGRAVVAPLVESAPLLGRELELARVETALRAAEQGRGGALLVTGEAGMGKSCLLEALLAGAAEHGFHALRGGAHEEEGRAPYAPLVEALDPLLLERPELVAALGDGARAVLALLMPSAPSEPTPVAADRHRVFWAIGQLLARAAASRPVVLVLDDIQAADEATIGLVHYLGRLARTSPVLVACGMRSERPPEAVARLRKSLAERRIGDEIELGRLDRDAVRSLAERAAGRPLPPAAVRAIERTSAGIPFFVEELAMAVDSSGEVGIPARLDQVLEARVDGLQELPVEVRAGLAVLEDGFDRGELAGICGGEREAVSALEAARQANVIEATQAGHRFRHPLVREALIARLPPAQLEQAHRRAAEQLATEGAPPERIAHHLLSGGRAAEAVPLLVEASGWADEVGAYGDGLEWVERALPHAAGAQRTELLALRARLLDRTGDRRAAAAYSEAIEVASGEEATELRLLRIGACVAAGELREARATLAEIEVEEPGDRGRVALREGIIAWFEGDLEASQAAADEAKPLLEAAGPDDDLALLDDLGAMLAHVSGEWEAHSSRRLRETAHLPALAGRVFDAYLCVTEYVLYSGEPYARLASFATRLRAEARQAGARRGEAFATTLLGEIELLVGNAEAARDRLLEAAGLSREIGASGGEALARARLAEALLAIGDRDGAAAHLEEALELAQASTLARHLLYFVHAAMIAVPGDAPGRLAAVERAEALLAGQRLCGYCQMGFQIEATIACALAAEPTRARAFLARAERGADLCPPGPWRAALALARGHLYAAEGSGTEARRAMRRAAEGFAAAGQRANERRAQEALHLLGADLATPG